MGQDRGRRRGGGSGGGVVGDDVPRASPGDVLRGQTLDFQIEKTYANLVEAARRASASSRSFYVLLFFTGVLIFGEGIGVADQIRIPFVELTVDKRFVALLSLFLSVLLVFQSGAFGLQSRLLALKLGLLVRERYPVLGGLPWNLNFPTSEVALTRFINANVPPPFGLIVVGMGRTIAEYLTPLVLAWYWGKDGGYGWGGRFLVCTAVAIILLPTMAANFRVESGDPVTALRRVEEGDEQSERLPPI
jgi:hypothetical protein